MKWLPEELHPADIIRVKIGSVYHYGIFVSEEEVIAFGYPPVNILGQKDSDVRVVSTDIDVFCAGAFVERGVMDVSEKKKALAPDEVIARARARVGEGGYSLLHNNCEHFVNECVFGERRSEQEDKARERYNKRPLFAVFFAEIPEDLKVGKLYPKSRNRELLLTGNPAVKRQRYAVWKLLEEAVSRSFGYAFESLDFRKTREGKWTVPEFYFSLSHTEGACAVVVSNAPCGVDVENVGRRRETYEKAPEKLRKLETRILSPAEKEADSGEVLAFSEELMRFLTRWTQKESIFKAYDGKKYIPDQIDPAKYLRKTCRIPGNPELLLSASGDQLELFTLYRVRDGKTERIALSELEEQEVR